MVELETDDYYDDAPSKPYKRLWAAKLMVHVKDYTSYLRFKRAVKKTIRGNTGDGELAEAWIYSNSKEVSSFLWICELLNLNPHRAREAIERNWRTLGKGEKDGRTLESKAKSKKVLPAELVNA